MVATVMANGLNHDHAIVWPQGMREASTVVLGLLDRLQTGHASAFPLLHLQENKVSAHLHTARFAGQRGVSII